MSHTRPTHTHTHGHTLNRTPASSVLKQNGKGAKPNSNDLNENGSEVSED